MIQNNLNETLVYNMSLSTPSGFKYLIDSTAQCERQRTAVGTLRPSRRRRSASSPARAKAAWARCALADLYERLVRKRGVVDDAKRPNEVVRLDGDKLGQVLRITDEEAAGSSETSGRTKTSGTHDRRDGKDALGLEVIHVETFLAKLHGFGG